MIGATERVAVYDDYAHHPTAARLATAAIKERHAGAFLAVAFQPHTRSRTEAMFDAFADALGGEGGVDALVVTPVFDARPERQGQIRGSEDEASGAEASDLAARLAARAGGAFAATEAEAVDAVVDAVRDATTSTKTRPAREDDFHGKKQVVVLCLGAGAGFDVARRVFARLDERDPGSASGSAAESRSAASRHDADETTR